MRKLLRNFFYFVLLCASSPHLSHAFYAWQGEDSSVELRGQLRIFGALINNPDNAFIYQKKKVSGIAGVSRFMLDAHVGPHFSYEVHTEQSYVPKSLQAGGIQGLTLQDVDRSDIFDRSFSKRQAHVLFDRLNVQYESDDLNIKIGRQAINLASTFFFTPNDFFAPFSAQTFYRSYKAGVDAARADIQLGEFSQVSFIGVLGYTQDPSSDSGWSSQEDIRNSSYLSRISTMFDTFEWAALGGVVSGDRVIGGDVQGELFEWLGVRAEGHMRWPDKSVQTSFSEFTIGLEHRWENTITLRVEQFYHGRGASSVRAYVTPTPATLYLAKRYTALGISYELTALLTGDVVWLRNGVDASNVFAAQLLYSISDESEFQLQVNIPTGEKDQTPVLPSEFGIYPQTVNVEWRTYF